MQGFTKSVENTIYCHNTKEEGHKISKQINRHIGLISSVFKASKQTFS